MNISKLTIIMPAYNEEATIFGILKKVHAVTLPGDIKKEFIVVNDGSTDGTEVEIRKFIQEYPQEVEYIHFKKNRGKGACIAAAVKQATGDYVIIQDADLEYDPEEYRILIKPVVEGLADVVYGSRFRGGQPHRILFFWHSIGNKFLTFLSNIFTNLNLTDMETGYKLIDTSLLKKLKLRERRFGFEPEVTARLAQIPGIRFYEVGISYYGRGFKEGKKINWKDGLRAIYCIFKYNLSR